LTGRSSREQDTIEPHDGHAFGTSPWIVDPSLSFSEFRLLCSEFRFS
jgi:hypothetical protein